MKPLWKNGKLTVELHKPDRMALAKARDIGKALVAMNQDSGKALVSAVDAILNGESGKEILEETVRRMEKDLAG